MNTKKKRFVPKKRLIKHFLALTLAGTLLLPGLVLIQPQEVEASIIVDMASGVVGKIRYTTTIAEIIVSLLTGSGASVTNTTWLNQINQGFGIESTLATATGTDGTIGAMYEAGLFSIDEAGHFIDNGLADAIRSVPEYSSTGVSELFATTSTDMELGAWQIADSATNLGEAASAGIAVGTLGQVAGAVAMGVNLGIVANKVCNYFGKKMAMAAPLTYPVDIINNVPVGYKMGDTQRTRFGSASLGFAPVDKGLLVRNTTSRRFEIWNVSNNDMNYKYANNSANPGSDPRWSWSSGYISSGNKYTVTDFDDLKSYSGWVDMTQSQVDSFIQSNNGQGVPSNMLPYSPDVVGSAGNQMPSNYQQPTNPISWPNLRPSQQLQQDDTGITPIPWSDYIDQTQIFNQNTTNNNTTIQQGDTYNNFVTQYITTPSEIPDDTTIESPNYNPTVPEQPTPNPKEELTTEIIQDTTDYMTTPGLKDVFPFSIPWDIAGLFNVFSTNNREAPVITFPLVSKLFGIDEEITIDLSPYDDVAALLRLLELIAFGLGLAFVTRYLIGAGG